MMDRLHFLLPALGDAWLSGMWLACWQGALAIGLAWSLCHILGEKVPARLRPWL